MCVCMSISLILRLSICECPACESWNDLTSRDWSRGIRALFYAQCCNLMEDSANSMFGWAAEYYFYASERRTRWRKAISLTNAVARDLRIGLCVCVSLPVWTKSFREHTQRQCTDNLLVVTHTHTSTPSAILHLQSLAYHHHHLSVRVVKVWRHPRRLVCVCLHVFFQCGVSPLQIDDWLAYRAYCPPHRVVTFVWEASKVGSTSRIFFTLCRVYARHRFHHQARRIMSSTLLAQAT